jgi:hypothetical protein
MSESKTFVCVACGRQCQSEPSAMWSWGRVCVVCDQASQEAEAAYLTPPEWDPAAAWDDRVAFAESLAEGSHGGDPSDRPSRENVAESRVSGDAEVSAFETWYLGADAR